jgi:Ni,Fe-hydrogenase maturation factor
LPTSTGEAHIIRDKEMIQYKYMEEEDHIHSTQLPSLIAALAATAMAARLLPLQPYSLSLFSLTHTLSLSLSLSLSLILLSK